jgi:hypothetical protein
MVSVKKYSDFAGLRNFSISGQINLSEIRNAKIQGNRVVTFEDKGIINVLGRVARYFYGPNTCSAILSQNRKCLCHNLYMYGTTFDSYI